MILASAKHLNVRGIEVSDMRVLQANFRILLKIPVFDGDLMGRAYPYVYSNLLPIYLSVVPYSNMWQVGTNLAAPVFLF
jgi:DUF917 family protein